MQWLHDTARQSWLLRDAKIVRRLLAEGIWILAGQIATMAGSLLLVRVLTSRLDPRAYGELALGLTIAGLINQTITGSISNGISRYWSIADEQGEHEAYIAAARRMMKYALVAIVAAGFLFVAILYATDLSHWIGLTLAAVALSISSGMNSALNGIQTAARQRSIVAMHTATESWLKVGLSALFVSWVGVHSAVVVLAYACSATLINGSQVLFLLRLLRRRGLETAKTASANRTWVVDMWSYSWPFATWGIFTWAQTSSDRWALQLFANTESVGLYAVLYQLGFTPISLGSGMLVTLLAPIMFQRAGDAKDPMRVANVYRSTAQVAKIVMVVALAIAMVFAMLHKWIFGLLTTARFASSSYLMPWMAIAAGLQACHQVLGIRISSLLKTQSIIIPQISSAVLFCLLNMLGAYMAGTKGLIAGIVVGSFIYVSWMLILTEYYRSHTAEFASQAA